MPLRAKIPDSVLSEVVPGALRLAEVAPGSARKKRPEHAVKATCRNLREFTMTRAKGPNGNKIKSGIQTFSSQAEPDPPSDEEFVQDLRGVNGRFLGGARESQKEVDKSESSPTPSPRGSNKSTIVTCNLRQLSLARRRIREPPAVAEETSFPSEDELISDLKGCNGKWRRRKAEQQWPLHLQRKEEALIAQKAMEDRLAQKKVREKMKEKKLIEMERQRQQMEQERAARAARQREIERLAEEERARLLAEEQERLRLASLPRTCQRCEGTGKCQPCGGKGYFLALYLAPVVSERAPQFHGRTMRGCEDCGGLRVETLDGQPRNGTGKCEACGGEGKIAADVGNKTERWNNKYRYSNSM